MNEKLIIDGLRCYLTLSKTLYSWNTPLSSLLKESGGGGEDLPKIESPKIFLERGDYPEKGRGLI